MLTELCQELKNWFDKTHGYELEKASGTWTISGNTLTVDFLKSGQYFRIIGSVFNDGVHQYPADDLIDEEFNGEVWAMAVPPEVVTLASKISAWREKYEDADSPAMSPFSSESFGGYSYSKGTSGSSGSAAGADWTSAFSKALNRWRKL